MKFAFDWGGTLSNNPELREIARLLVKEGHEVHIISVAWPREKREEHLAKHKGELFTHLHVILETGSTEHGREKAKIMEDIGCRVIFDDNLDVTAKVTKRGMLGIKIPYKDH